MDNIMIYNKWGFNTLKNTFTQLHQLLDKSLTQKKKKASF